MDCTSATHLSYFLLHVIISPPRFPLANGAPYPAFFIILAPLNCYWERVFTCERFATDTRRNDVSLPNGSKIHTYSVLSSLKRTISQKSCISIHATPNRLAHSKQYNFPFFLSIMVNPAIGFPHLAHLSLHFLGSIMIHFIPGSIKPSLGKLSNDHAV